jgi:hypothetical protein
MTLFEHAAAVRRFWSTIGTKKILPKLSAEGEALLAAIERVPDGVLVSRAALERWRDGCWCDDRDGNCNPPHNANCERCAEIAALLRG